MKKKLIPKEKQKLVYIEWQDAHAFSSWMTEEALQEEINVEQFIVESIGWIVFENKDEIDIVSERAKWSRRGYSQYGQYQCIPKAWIRKRKVLIK